VVYAKAVIFYDDFENGLQGWTGHPESFTITDSYAYSGQHAVINNGIIDKVLLQDIGDHSDIIYECWFYDLMGSISETVCLVTKGQYSSADFLLIGTETQLSSTHYTYFLSPDVNSWGTTTIPRSLGWHKAQFVKGDGKTELYLDDTKIAETTNNNNWIKIGVALNNWNSDSHDAAIFDSLSVVERFKSKDKKPKCPK
jgi:hypothetical protein